MSLACPLPIADFLPDLCAAVDHYCERTSSALSAEPVNALTNAAFLISAWGVWRLQSGNPGQGDTGLFRILSVLIAIVGLGSFLFHTVATRWAEWGDVVPILAFMLLWLWLAFTRFFSWSTPYKLITLFLFFAATFGLEAAAPPAILWGGALYLPTIFIILAIMAALHHQRQPASTTMAIAVAVFILSFTARTLDMPLCAAFPLGTHFLWHILNAVLLYLLARVLILYNPARTRMGI